MEPTLLTPDQVDAFMTFVATLEDGDVAFIREHPDDPETVQAWASGSHHGKHWIVLDDHGAVGAYVAVVPLTGWAGHIGELRLVVRPDLRGKGLGKKLAQHALVEAAQMNLHKLQVNLVADQESLVSMFNSLGFQPEALLADHFRTGSGEYRDLMILTHSAHDEWGALATLGVDQAVAQQL